MLGILLKGDTQYTSWYLGLFDNNYTPLAEDTMGTLIGACGENVDYTGTARKTITFPSVSDGAVTTVADPNVFEFTSSETIRGAFITTASAWSSTTGLLLSAVLFASPKSLSSGESLKVPVGFALTS